MEFTYDYAQYLSAKRTVDERSLSMRVWSAFMQHLRGVDEPIRILEIGAGIGATCIRVIEAFSYVPITYTLMDIDAANLDACKYRIRAWAKAKEHIIDTQKRNKWTVKINSKNTTLNFIHQDALDVETGHQGATYNAVIAQCVLDLFDAEQALRSLGRYLKHGGFLYAASNFDGVTTMLPVADLATDKQVETLYHRSMRRQTEHGRSDGAHAGRNLLSHLMTTSWSIVEAGSSDWVVLPTPGAGYRFEERYFLRCMLHFIESELSDHPDIDDDVFSDWMRTRLQQLKRGRLGLIIHQLDVLAAHNSPMRE